MDVLTLPLAVIGITQFVKLAVKQVANYDIEQSLTIVVAVVVAAALTFVNLDSDIIQNVYAAAVAVGGLTGVSKIATSVKK